MPNKVIKNSFNAGELSEALSGRTDLEKYYNGCSQLVNATVLPYGGAVKRSGTEYIAHAKGKCRLIPFEFSADDTMIIEMGDEYLRFYKDGEPIREDAVAISGITQADPGVVTSNAHGFSDGDWLYLDIVGMTDLDDKTFIVDSATANTFQLQTMDGTDVDTSGYDAFTSGDAYRVYEITSPYTIEDVFSIHYNESADVIYMAHQDYPPQKLSRLDDDDWTIEDIEFEGGPFQLQNTDTSKTIKVSLPNSWTGSYLTGTHTTGAGVATLEDTGAAWTIDEFVGYTLYNSTDGSSGTVTANTATTITATLSGGLDNDWDVGDEYSVFLVNGYYIPSGTTSLTATATGHTPFLGTSTDVGTKWQLSHNRSDNTDSVQTTSIVSTLYTKPISTKGDFNVECNGFETADNDLVEIQRKVGDGEWIATRSFTAASSYTSTEEEDDVQYRVKIFNASGTPYVAATFTAKNQIHDGTIEITSHSSTTVATVTAVTDIYYDSTLSDNDTYMWSEGSWSERRGYPKTIAFHDDRLWFAGTPFQPQTLWASRTSDYENFTRGDLDNEGVQVTIQDADVSQIQWLSSDEVLLCGTVRKEYKLTANNVDDPMTPDDVRIRPQSSYGSLGIQPARMNNALFYAQGQGRKIRAMQFADAIQKFDSDDATILSNHMFESTPVQFAVQMIPDAILWVNREDGVLCSFSYEPKEEVNGWARHITGKDQQSSILDGNASPTSLFESVAVIRGDTEDDLWVSVKRTIDGTAYRYVEKMATRIFDQLDQAIMMDAAKVQESDALSQSIVLASDTVRCGSGLCNSSQCGGTT